MTITISKFKLALGIVAVALVGATAAWAAEPFDDVPDVGAADEAFFSEPVDWLWNNSLTTGSPSGSNTFKPFDNVTRGEYATFNFRYDQNVVQPALTDLQDQIDANEAAAPTIYHAWVANDGSSSLKSDGVTTSSPTTGTYTIVFPEDVTECTWQATHRFVSGFIIFDPDNTGEPEFSLATRTSGFIPPITTFPTDINVFVTDEAGDAKNTSFDLTVICP